MKHTLKVFNFNEGILNAEEFFFETIEEAKEHIKLHKGLKKIYDELGALLHSEDENGCSESYA
jgi:hypothetical protein